jgi:DivIVA domain-containing protein
MPMQSSSVATTTFKIVKKGYDPDEVRAYLKEVGTALQTAQEHAATVEARARQAIARAKEEAAHAASSATPARGTRVDDTETISRTLLLAQKTADETVARAQQEADSLLAASRSEASSLLSEARGEVARASDTARAEARRAGESERQKVESELQQLLARLEFLRDDVTQMEAHTAHQRERLLQVADELQTIATRPTAGLGDSRRPVLSAAADLDRAELTTTQAVPTVLPSDTTVDDMVAAEADTAAEPAAAADTAGTDPGPSTLAAERASIVEQLFETHDDQLDITAEVPVVE